MSIYDSMDMISVCAAAVAVCAIVCTVALLVVLIRMERSKY